MSTVTTLEARPFVTVVDLELPPVLESVPYARDLAACRVAAPMRRDVELVVSELVANAVKHGTGPVGVRVDTDGARVRIEVQRSPSGQVAWAEVSTANRS